MTADTFSQIPRGVLAHLLDMCGPPAEMSPRRLMGAAEDLNPLQIAQLYAGGYLSEARLSADSLTHRFRRAAEVVLAPRTNLTVRLWGAEELCAETNVQFPGPIADGGGVMLLPVSGGYRMSAFVEPDDILADISRALPPVDSRLVSPFVFEGHFDAPVASVLFALIDLHRNSTRRRDGHAAHEVFGYLEGQWGLTGANQLTTYVQAVGMQSAPPSILEVETALAQLERTGSVAQARPGAFRVSDELQPLVDLTRSLVSGFQWERVTRQDDGALLVNARTYVYGDGGLTLCFLPTVKGRLLVGTADYGSVLDFVVGEIGGLTPIVDETAPRDEADEAARTLATERSILANARKPTTGAAKPGPSPAPAPDSAPKRGPQPEPASPLEDAAALTCAACGKAVRPGAKFCTHCGQKIEAAPTERLCRACGQPAKPEQKFCTSCGAKL